MDSSVAAPVDTLQNLPPFEERVTNIVTEGDITTAVYNVDSESKVNMYARAIMSEIETYAIHYVIFHINTSSVYEEQIALRFGMCPINNEEYVHSDDLRARVDVKNEEDEPIWVTTDDIPNIPFRDRHPIVMLRKDERLLCDIVVRKGTSAQHVKFRPLCNFQFTRIEGGFQIRIKTVGMLNGETVLRRGYEKIEKAAKRGAIATYFKPYVPEKL